MLEFINKLEVQAKIILRSQYTHQSGKIKNLIITSVE